MMKKKLLPLILFLLTALPSAAQELDFGYNEPWTAKTLYNPSRKADESWPQLCKASQNDVYTIHLPFATTAVNDVRLQLKTPVNILSSHRYRIIADVRVTNGAVPEVRLYAGENEDDAILFGSDVKDLSTGTARLTISKLADTAIQDLKLDLRMGGNTEGTDVEVSKLSIVDMTDGNRELWQGTLFFVQCSYVVGGSSIGEPDMSGFTESMDWTLPEYDDSMWENTVMPLGNQGFIPEVQTIWRGGDYNSYWIRRDFNLDSVDTTSGYTLRLCHDDSFKAYVNGHLIGQGEDWTTGKEFIELKVPSIYLNQGKNVIALYQMQNFGGKFSDCAFVITPGMYEDYDDIDPAEALVANELMVANIDQYIDYSYNYGAWLELYNTTDKTVNLGGLYFSDDPENPKKCMLPWDYGVVKPNDYAIVYFDHHSSQGTYGSTAYKQIPFSLDEEGGTIVVSGYSGQPFITLNYPAAIPRCSYARTTDGTGNWQHTGDASPAASNNGSMFSERRLQAPPVDTPSQLFTTPFTIHVGIPPGATLRYTLDGSTPDGESMENTTGDFAINETTTLRLRLFQQGMLPSEVVTRTYLEQTGDYYLPVLAISTNPDNLYDDYIGVYCQGKNGVVGHGNNSVPNNLNMDWERPVNVELITADNRMVVNQEAEFTIAGGWSRLYAPSSFKLKARNIFEGKKTFDYSFFSTKPYNKYKEIIVRNGGNDNDSPGHGRIKDAIIQQPITSSGIYVDAQELQPVHVFFNGEYIGMLNLRDPANKFYATANYGYDKDELDAFEYSNGYFQKAGDNKSFKQWVAISAKMADDSAMEQMRSIADVDEFINYMAAITYIGSSDWICNSNNSKGFRSRNNGKFHMVLFDVDWGFSNPQALATLLSSNANDLIRIFKNSVQNTAFRRQFVDAYCLMNGSVYTPERTKAIADSLARLMEPALALEGKQPWTSYNEVVPRMLSADQRATRMNTLREQMQLGTGMNVGMKANIPEAMFTINGLQVPLGHFDGTLFAPVTVETTAPAGYNFVGWQSTKSQTTALCEHNDSWWYYDQGSLDDTSWKTMSTIGNWLEGTAPLGYGKTDIATTTEQHLPTYYYRKTITLPRQTDDDERHFTINWTADDGFILYVNGKEALRHLMPDGTPTYNTLATSYAPANPDSGTAELPASLFHSGRNVIAVEVHNNVLTSSDIYWDAEIIMARKSSEQLSTKRTMTLDTDQDIQLTAIFEPLADEYLVSAGATPVVINELCAANTIFVNDYNKRNDWIELYNTTADPIDIRGMYLSDNPDNPHKWQISADDIETTIPAHGYLVIWADQLDPICQLHAPFKLKNATGECVLLTAADDSWSNRLDYDIHSGEESVGRYPDGGKRVYHMSRPTIGRTNQLTTYAQWLEGEDENFDPSTVGIDSHSDSLATAVTTQYYSVDGRQLQAPVPGVNIVRITRADGTVITRKIVVR